MLELGANTDYPMDYQTTSPNQVSAITASTFIVNVEIHLPKLHMFNGLYSVLGISSQCIYV
jgi:hypothetical protein